jgi:hypothetical protein
MTTMPSDFVSRSRRGAATGRAGGLLLLTACGAVALIVWTSTPKAAPSGPPSNDPAVLASRFEDAAASLGEQVQLLRVTPAQPEGDARIKRAVSALAIAIEDVPASQGVDVVNAANLMREALPEDVGGGQLDASTATNRIRAALEVASGALLLLSHGEYAGFPGVADRVTVVQRAVDTIEPGEPVEPQWRSIVTALGLASDTLFAMERVSGVDAPAIARTAASGAAPEGEASSGSLESAPEGVAETQGASPSRGFPSALASYSSWIDRFASVPPTEGPRALRHAFDALAEALATLPKRDHLVPAEVAEMHRLAADFERAPSLSPQQTRIARHVFERADGVLTQATRGEYREAPMIGADERSFHLEWASLDESQSLHPQLPRVLGSLEAAERVLRLVALVTAR